VPYRPTGRAPGRPVRSRCTEIANLSNKAAGLDTWAKDTRIKVAGLVASELASGKTHAELAVELGWSTSDIRRALRARPVAVKEQDITT
jgi:predicted transcriptional regulator